MTIAWSNVENYKDQRWHRTMCQGRCQGKRVYRYCSTPYLAGHETGKSRVGYMVDGSPRVYSTESAMRKAIERGAVRA